VHPDPVDRHIDLVIPAGRGIGQSQAQRARAPARRHIGTTTAASCQQQRQAGNQCQPAQLKSVHLNFFSIVLGRHDRYRPNTSSNRVCRDFAAG
jgi:hypothetical protein